MSMKIVLDVHPIVMQIGISIDTSHGRYYVSLRESRCEREIYDKGFRNTVWRTLEELSGVKLLTDVVPEVIGAMPENQLRCKHWHSELDIIALKMKCCNTFYSCIDCHSEATDHPPQQWERSEFDEKAVLCGSCNTLLTIDQYLTCGSTCPHCQAKFNPRCDNHYHYYFNMNA